MSFSLGKFLPLVPAVGGILLVLAAIYARTLIDALWKGIDKLASLRSIPAKDREKAFKVIEVGLKID